MVAQNSSFQNIQANNGRYIYCVCVYFPLEFHLFVYFAHFVYLGILEAAKINMWQKYAVRFIIKYLNSHYECRLLRTKQRKVHEY